MRHGEEEKHGRSRVPEYQVARVAAVSVPSRFVQFTQYRSFYPCLLVFTRKEPLRTISTELRRVLYAKRRPDSIVSEIVFSPVSERYGVSSFRAVILPERSNLTAGCHRLKPIE